MKLSWPKTKKEIPFYIFLYWIVIWGVIFLFTVFTTISSLTPDGNYVEITNCLKKDKQNTCLEYTQSYFVAAGTKLKFDFIQQGFYIGLLTIIIGGGLMYKNHFTRVTTKSAI